MYKKIITHSTNKFGIFMGLKSSKNFFLLHLTLVVSQKLFESNRNL